MNCKNQHRTRTFKKGNNMKPIRQTIYQKYCRIINTKKQKENALTQHIRDQIFGLEKRAQILKNHQDANRTKQAKLKIKIF